MEIAGLNQNEVDGSGPAAINDRADQTYHRLREMILSGQLPAGFHLKQVHLARMLNISQTPVREAIKLLEREGWVVSTFNQGTVVRTFSEKDFQDAYELREMLEGLTARKAATQLNDAQIAKLLSLARAIDEENTKGLSPTTLAGDKMDAEFHLSLAEWVGNRQVTEIFQRLLHLEMLMVARGSGTPNECLHIHIVQAIKSREPNWAETVARRHIREAYQKFYSNPTSRYQISPDGHRRPIQTR